MTRVVNIAQSGGNNVTMRNRIINGAMMIDQRNANASITIGTGATSFVADRFFCLSVGGQTFSVCDTSLPTGSGFQYAVKLQPQTGATSVQLNQRIEAFNSMDLAGQTVTLSFWVYTSGLSGTSSYAQPYTATSLNSFGSSTFGASQSISYTNGAWVRNTFTFSASNNSMNAANGMGIIFNFQNAVGSTIYITGVQLEAGTTATPFENRLYGTELALCQRYYEVTFADSGPLGIMSHPWNTFTNNYAYWQFMVQKRAAASASLINAGAWSGATPTLYTGISQINFYSATPFYVSYSSGTAATPVLAASAEL